MIRTLLLFDGKMGSTERIAGRIASLIGNTLASDIENAPEDLSLYDGFCLVFNFYGAVTAGRTRSWLIQNKNKLRGKRIVFVGVGFSDLGYSNYVSEAEKAADLTGIQGIFISSENETVRAGIETGRLMQAPLCPMQDADLLDRIEEFIDTHNTLALATGGDGYLSCTPVEYHYQDRVFYLITAGGSKFRGILENGMVSAAIFDTYTSQYDLHSLRFEGKAAEVLPGSEEYSRVMDLNGITEEQLRESPVNLFLVKIVPMRYEYLDSGLEGEGYDINQFLETDFLKKLWEEGAEYATAINRREMTNEEAAKVLMEKMALQKASENVKEDMPEDSEDYTPEEARQEEYGSDDAEEKDIPEETELPDEIVEAEMPDEITDQVLADEDDEEEIAENLTAGEEPDLLSEPQGESLQPADSPVLPQSSSFENAGNGFVMPSFMKPYLDDNADNREEKAGTVSQGNSIPLPAIDMSVLAGLESGGRHRFDEETEDEKNDRVRVKPVKFVEPEEVVGEPDDDPDFDEDDSPVFESRKTVRKSRKPAKERTAGKGRGTSKSKRKAGKEEKDRPSAKGSEKKKGGLFGKVGKALSRMLLIEAGEEDESYDDEDDEF